jgi:serine/threonine-protein kinase
MDNETNLLFGAVALSMDFIDTNQLSESWAKYVSNDDVSLSTILLEMEWITSNQATEISERVDQTVNEHGSADSALRSFADFGIHTSMGGFRDEDVQRRLSVMLLSATQMGQRTIALPKRSEDEADPGVVKTLDMPQVHSTRYTLTRVHGEGGLGRVWLARDHDLNREVALKELRHEADSESEARFYREAQITGQLEHPNIIPIYEVTRRETDNQLFYTMKFMRGQTLSERIIAHFKKRRDNDSDRVEFLEMMSSFVGICNAIGYAHSRGILHRDLKPQNVMMGAFGEVILLDWGLAKFIDENGTKRPVQVHESYSAKSTEQGQVLGTPAYMAPEQADGRTDQVDERTDIYGLGGILFAIVSGHAPHRPTGAVSVARKTQNLLKQISDGPTPSPDAVDSSVPAALVAICMKAMAKERSDRYGSASELANDVQRWLADEPISVYREPWRERVARWTRRNKTWTQAGAAALLIVAFVSTISAFVVNTARQEVEVALGKEQNAVKVANLALDAEEVAKAEAMQRFLESQKHVDEFFEGFSTGLQYWPGAEEIHTRLLEKAAANYQRFAEQKSDDPALIATAATASLRYGDMQLMLGNSKKATAAYQSAESTFLNLSKKHPTVLDYQLQLVSSRNRLGELFSTHDSFEDAIRSFDAALDGLNALSKEHSDLAKYKLAKAGVLRNRALFFQQVDKLKESESALLESVSLFSELSKNDDLPEYNEGLAQTRNNLGGTATKDRPSRRCGCCPSPGNRRLRSARQRSIY